ncbi:MAG: cupin domain-containing protein [Deltaproteobacteria bacterium]|nr:cupin domain-containing protein [Deltaproteobacteria bacterium]
MAAPTEPSKLDSPSPDVPDLPAIVRRADSVPAQEVAVGNQAKVQVLLGPEDGMPNFALRRFLMAEGGGMPLHTNTVEHEQFVLRGRARVLIGDQTLEVSAGNVLFIPGGVPHSYSVVEGPFEFLCIVPNSPDRLEILDSSC